LLQQKTKTLELKPESKRYSSTLEKKKEKPVFLSQLSPAAVTSGETARFTVKVSGFPKPTVQWSHNGKVIKSSSIYKVIEEKEEYTLVITRVTSEYEGEYSCTATNRFGQTTCTTYLEVKKPDVSGEVSFNYKASGDPVPDVKWFKGAFQIQPSRNCIIIVNPDGSGSITIKSIKQEDSGLYTCKASNQFGEASCSAELVLFREPPPVSHKQEQLTVVQKKGYKVSVTEQATESRLYQVSLPGQDRDRSDQMVYTIGTEDRQIIPSEQVVSLREVIRKPSFVKTIEPASAAVNDPLRLECQVDEDTGVTVTWTRDGKKVHQSMECKLSFEDKVAVLDIPKTKLRDSGKYVCTAANEAGSSSCETLIAVKGLSNLEFILQLLFNSEN
uniref:Ig-like domain-containing protein n=1 Tax=Monopterus albus TaxID=43700 RepID=A0A3Q3JJB4_MONAL